MNGVNRWLGFVLDWHHFFTFVLVLVLVAYAGESVGLIDTSFFLVLLPFYATIHSWDSCGLVPEPNVGRDHGTDCHCTLHSLHSVRSTNGNSLVVLSTARAHT